MILADKIIELRKKNGWSQEDLAEMLGVSRQSISKWEGAQSVPDMNRIIKMSEVFGVSTDLLLKDELTLEEPDAAAHTKDLPEDMGELRNVPMEEASSFLKYKSISSDRIALGVFMCIISPILVIILEVSSETGYSGLTSTAAGVIGVIVLLLLVAGAVALFVTCYMNGHRFGYLEKELIETAYGVDGMTREKKEAFRRSYVTQLVLGIVLCIISVVPVIAATSIEEDGMIEAVGTSFCLLLVAIGVFLIVRVSIIWGGFQMLLQEGDYSTEHKIENKRNEHLSTVYWCVVITIYLAWSFITNAWERTWIIWPVAGVAYGAVTAVARILRSRN